MKIERKNKSYYTIDTENYYFFVQQMKQLLHIKEMIKQYDLDLLKSLCVRFKMHGEEIYFSETEVGRFNDMLKYLHITANELKIDMESEAKDE